MEEGWVLEDGTRVGILVSILFSVSSRKQTDLTLERSLARGTVPVSTPSISTLPLNKDGWTPESNASSIVLLPLL